MQKKGLPRWAPMTTVAAVIERKGRFLLVHEQTSDGLLFNTPAGHLERGETLVEACVREVREETAWEFKPTGLLGIYMHRFRSSRGEDVTYMRYAFTGILGQPLDTPLDDGIIEAVWLSYDEIVERAAEHRTPMLMQCIDDYRAKQGGIPLEVLHSNGSIYDDPLV